MLDFQITDFWDWFAKKSNKLYSDNYATEFLAKLDETISSWRLGWKIGPGLIKENSLTISPNGNKKLLDHTNKIINRAPNLTIGNFILGNNKKKIGIKQNLLTEI